MSENNMLMSNKVLFQLLICALVPLMLFVVLIGEISFIVSAFQFSFLEDMKPLFYFLIEFFMYSRKKLFLILFSVQFLLLAFALVSKVKKNPEIRAKYWMKMFGISIMAVLVNIFFGYSIDYVAKPIIYLYPTEETDVTVTVGKPENLTHTYPKYEDGWRVTAWPNGDLKDEKGRSYYALYWEGVRTNKPQMTEGFIVKGSDTIPFLEEKLALLGLTEREANEFIVYWLPKLESNEYNLIRFETKAEIDDNMPLYITPNPDTTIRMMMEYRSADKSEQVKEQQLPPTPQRKGFVAVEWGGTLVK